MRAKSMLIVVAMVGCVAPMRTREPALDLTAGELPEAIPLTKSQRAGRTVQMGNSLAGFALARDFQRTPGPVRWSPWEGYCCESGARTRSCTTVDADALASCRHEGKLAVVCKELANCSGPECFCCSNGLEHACTLDRIDDEPEHDEPGPPDRSTPSVWSPY
jgi:hypothetical protein